MNRNTVVILVLVCVFIVIPALLAGVAGVVMLLRDGGSPFSLSKNEVALFRIEGVITSDRGSSGFMGGSSAGAERIVDELESFRKDKSLKSAVIRINSPGGSAAGSQEIYQEIQKVRREGKKVTISMGDVAASGGYYVAAAADRILADQATLTGSIGVILSTSDMHELYDKIGVKMGAVKTGPYKDIGSSSRPMTNEEKQILQVLVNDVYDQFIVDVSHGRKIPAADVRKMADGRVFTGRQAVKLKLVDKIGSLQDALKAAAGDAGIMGDFDVVEYGRDKGVFDMLVGDSQASLPEWLKRMDALSRLAQTLLADGRYPQLR